MDPEIILYYALCEHMDKHEGAPTATLQCEGDRTFLIVELSRLNVGL